MITCFSHQKTYRRQDEKIAEVQVKKKSYNKSENKLGKNSMACFEGPVNLTKVITEGGLKGGAFFVGGRFNAS